MRCQEENAKKRPVIVPVGEKKRVRGSLIDWNLQDKVFLHECIQRFPVIIR